MDATLRFIARLADGPATFDELTQSISLGGRQRRGARTTYRYLRALREAGYEVSRGPAYELLDHPLRDWRPPSPRDERKRRTGPLHRMPGLRRRRKKLGLTQAEVARRAGLSAVTVRHAEKGRRVRLTTARAIAEAFSAVSGPSPGEKAA